MIFPCHWAAIVSNRGSLSLFSTYRRVPLWYNKWCCVFIYTYLCSHDIKSTDWNCSHSFKVAVFTCVWLQAYQCLQHIGFYIGANEKWWDAKSQPCFSRFQCPFICHLLYLLTRKESGTLSIIPCGIWSVFLPFPLFTRLLQYFPILVFSPALQALLTGRFFCSLIVVRVFRVRKLLELQSKLVNILFVFLQPCLRQLYFSLLCMKILSMTNCWIVFPPYILFSCIFILLIPVVLLYAALLGNINQKWGL